MNQPTPAPQRRDSPQPPSLSLPSMPKLREQVKDALHGLMKLPALGPIVRAVAAEQRVIGNLRVDQLTYFALQKLLLPESCCIDVGAHVGDITKMFLDRAPQGRHFAFEPLTECFEKLQQRFAGKLNISLFAYALSDETGARDFTAVTNCPGFSGLANRTFAGREPGLEPRTVEVRRLDDLIPPEMRIDFIKLDIEGAELKALQGARRILQESKPTLLLEFQQTGAPYFGCTPDEMFTFLEEQNYQVWNLEGWLHGRPPLNLASLWDLFVQDPTLNLLCRPRDRH